MTELVRLLRFAHAVEVGAYHAYEGHWRSLPTDSIPQNTIKAIQQDELNHRQDLKAMLEKLGSKPSPFLDAILWCIGKSISLGCKVMGYHMAMWGAKIMERMGANIYGNLINAAIDARQPRMVVELIFMRMAEEDHEKYIKICMSEYRKIPHLQESGDLQYLMRQTCRPDRDDRGKT